MPPVCRESATLAGRHALQGTGDWRGAASTRSSWPAARPRLGGADKAALELAGATLLERALDAVAGAGEVVVGRRPGADDRGR